MNHTNETAAEAYARQLEEAHRLQAELGRVLDRHADSAGAQPANGGFVGDLASLNEQIRILLHMDLGTYADQQPN